MGFKVISNVVAEESTFEEHPEIQKYLSEFQVKLINEDKHIDCDLSSSAGSEIFKFPGFNSKSKVSSITVFKKKNLKKIGLHHSQTNIYEHNLSQPDLEKDDPTKSKVSCLRCRKFKKRCSRALPECSNCLSCDDLCVYLPRKSKAKKNRSSSGLKVNVGKKMELLSASKRINMKVESDSTKKRLSLPNLLNYSIAEGNGKVQSTKDNHVIENSTSNYSYESKAGVVKHSNDFSVILN